ncbi:MAG: hypothetical protein EZS28_034067, partial [Streblomastix strix]
MNIGAPEKGTFKQMVHVRPDPQSATGLAGLPPEWEVMLKTSGITKAEIAAHSDVVINLMQKNAPMILKDQLSTDRSTSRDDLAPLPKQEELKRQMKWDRIIRSGCDVDREYPVRKRIGEGSTGYVYVALHKGEKDKVALKVMLITEETDTVALLNEIYLMKANGKHPNIVGFHDAFTIIREIIQDGAGHKIVKKDEQQHWQVNPQSQNEQNNKQDDDDDSSDSSSDDNKEEKKAFDPNESKQKGSNEPGIQVIYHGDEDEANAIMNAVKNGNSKEKRKSTHFDGAKTVTITTSSDQIKSNTLPQGIIEREKQLWICMDYMAGGSLTQIITVCGTFPERVISYFCREILKGLQFMHKQ